MTFESDIKELRKFVDELKSEKKQKTKPTAPIKLEKGSLDNL